MNRTPDSTLRSLAPHPWLAHVVPYRAGAKAASGAGSLAQNEIPSASPAATAAIADAAQAVNRYPDPLATRLRERLAELHAVDPDQILVGGGSDEFLFLLSAAFGGPGSIMCCADPPYWGHEHPALISGADVVKIPLHDYRHDLDRMKDVDASIAFISNPHNPTGTCVNVAEIERFSSTARADLVVVDEAYLEFTDQPENTTAIPLVAKGNVVVLRTFSKYYGLAGARVGYLIATPDLVAVLRKVRPPFSVSLLAQAAALAVLNDIDFNVEMLRRIRRNRARVAALFESAGYRSVPSQANFLLVHCLGAESHLVSFLQDAGITVRPGTNLGIPGTVRITIPDDDGLALLEAALTSRGVKAQDS